MSLQLSAYLQLRADGVPVEQAAERSSIGLVEAQLWEADIEAGEIQLPRARAGAREEEPGETVMANGNVAADELRLFIERIERIKEEIVGLNDDVRDVYAEAKARGFDTKAMKSCIKIRSMEPHARSEADAILSVYLDALGIRVESALAIAA